jgi:lipoate-protein ligase A
MRFLNLSGLSPEAQLACDETMLNWAEDGLDEELLRFYEPSEPFVVVGLGNEVQKEVRVDACRARRIPVLRRCSGGGAVLQAPGCVNYSLVLRVRPEAGLRDIHGTHERVLERHQKLLERLLGGAVGIQGTSDLTLGALKFSGNAQRRKQRFALYHGTFLLALDVELLEALLQMPTRRPAYRHGRAHRDFVTVLPLRREPLLQGLREAWEAREPIAGFPSDRLQDLVRTKYSQDAWNFKR